MLKVDQNILLSNLEDKCKRSRSSGAQPHVESKLHQMPPRMVQGSHHRYLCVELCLFSPSLTSSFCLINVLPPHSTIPTFRPSTAKLPAQLRNAPANDSIFNYVINNGGERSTTQTNQHRSMPDNRRRSARRQGQSNNPIATPPAIAEVLRTDVRIDRRHQQRLVRQILLQPRHRPQTHRSDPGRRRRHHRSCAAHEP
jgi:hypothetical protein